MKAVRYERTGGPEVLRYVDVPDPVPGPGDVVVGVRACGVNRLDVVQRAGWFHLPGFSLPHVAGMDVAGEVVEVGDDVTTWQPGDRVVVDPLLDAEAEVILGATVDGGYAERCVVPADRCHRIPDHVPYEHAATFPTAYLTAHHALFDVGRLQQGETLLVHAAGSSLSIAALNLARHAGATVLVTAGSDAKCERALALGAKAAANNRTTDVAAWAKQQTDGRGVDLVFDHVGTALFAASLAALTTRGRLVVAGNTSGDEATIPSLGDLYHRGLQILGADAYRSEEFAPVWELFCTAGFPVVVDETFPLAEAGAAQEKLLRAEAFGKLVLRP